MRFLSPVFVVSALLSTLAACAYGDDAKKPETITNSIGMRLVLIPAGKFQMGSPADEKERTDEERQHRVRITKPFYMGIYPVTQSEYKRIMGRNTSTFRSTTNELIKKKLADVDTDQLPVETVSWNAAAKFCLKLGKQEERTYRLPTEAEWEYACRAGTTTPFYFGEQLKIDEANFSDEEPFGGAKGKSLERTTKVGSYRPNAFGLYDMHGNVYQWCEDVHTKGQDYDTDSPVDDPVGPDEGECRIARGGSWNVVAGECRAAYRNYLLDTDRIFCVGFRVVLEREPSVTTPEPPSPTKSSDRDGSTAESASLEDNIPSDGAAPTASSTDDKP